MGCLMKKKSIVVLGLVAMIIFMIYMKLKDRSIYYLNMQSLYGEMEYSYLLKEGFEKKKPLEKFVEFKYEDMRITDLINKIQNNDYIYLDEKKQTIQNALIKADIITLFIGMDEIAYGLKKEEKEDIYAYLDTVLEDIEMLFLEIRKYSKEEIFFIGFYTEEEKEKEYIGYLNQKLEKISSKEKVHYIELASNTNKTEQMLKIKESILSEFTFS